MNTPHRDRGVVVIKAAGEEPVRKAVAVTEILMIKDVGPPARIRDGERNPPTEVPEAPILTRPVVSEVLAVPAVMVRIKEQHVSHAAPDLGSHTPQVGLTDVVF